MQFLVSIMLVTCHVLNRRGTQHTCTEIFNSKISTPVNSSGPFELQELNQAAERHKPELDAHPIPPVSRSESRDQHPALDCEWSLNSGEIHARTRKWAPERMTRRGGGAKNSFNMHNPEEGSNGQKVG